MSTTSNVVAVPKSTTISGPPKCRCAGERVQQAVGADLVRVVDLDLEAPVERGARDQRLDAEPVPAQPAQMVQRGRHHRAEHGGAISVALQPDVGEQRQQPHRVFVGGALRVGADAPGAAPALSSCTAKTMLVLPASITRSMAMTQKIAVCSLAFHSHRAMMSSLIALFIGT